MKQLVIYPDDFLRKESQPVLEFGHALDQVVQDMTWVMRSLAGDAIGISAVQTREPLRLGLIELRYNEKKKGTPFAFCNPEILELEGQQLGPEGCLSFPGKFFDLPCFQLVRFKYQDLQGRVQHQIFTGLMARCFLHEVDHMNGRLFIDRLEICKACGLPKPDPTHAPPYVEGGNTHGFVPR